MKKSKLLLRALADSAAAFTYIAGVAWLIFNGEKFFGKVASFWAPLAMLLLFVLSALITGLLILGGPVYFYFEGKKKEAISLLLYTAAFFFIITFLVFVFLII